VGDNDMTPISWLSRLRAHGLNARIVDGQMQIGPKDRISQELLGLAREHKSEIMAELETLRLGAADDGSPSRTSALADEASAIDPISWCRHHGGELDPRESDYADDSTAWHKLLSVRMPLDLWASLRLLRCMGAGLRQQGARLVLVHRNERGVLRSAQLLEEECRRWLSADPGSMATLALECPGLSEARNDASVLGNGS